MKTDPVSETLCFPVFRSLEDGQSPRTMWFKMEDKLINNTIQYCIMSTVSEKKPIMPKRKIEIKTGL
jgi:hypothetical protein